MLGYGSKDYKEATYIINDQLPHASKVPDEVTSLPAGRGLIVGHPRHIFNVPHDPWYADYLEPPLGHGPLRVLHSALSIGEGEDSNEGALQRAAMGGPLALLPLDTVLSGYSTVPEQSPLSCWQNGDYPKPQDLHLYEIDRLRSV
jgi:hypothetical protein